MYAKKTARISVKQEIEDVKSQKKGKLKNVYVLQYLSGEDILTFVSN